MSISQLTILYMDGQVLRRSCGSIGATWSELAAIELAAALSSAALVSDHGTGRCT